MTAFSIRVAGSSGDHDVSRAADGQWRCSCKGFRFGRGKYCRHILSMHRPTAPAPLQGSDNGRR